MPGNSNKRLSRRRLLQTTTSIGLVAVAGCGNSGNEDTSTGGNGNEVISAGESRWEFTEPSAPISTSPTVVDGTVYIGTEIDDSTLYAVDAETGDKEWAFTEPDAQGEGLQISSPTVSEGTVYVGATLAATESEDEEEDGTLYAVDVETGEREWAFTEPSKAVYSSPTVVDGTVYVGSDDGTLYAVDAETGEQAWAFTDPSGPVGSSPTVADGTVYIGAEGFRTLFAVDAETGGNVWTFTDSAQPMSSPTVVDGTLYVGSFGSTLYAVNAGVEGSSEDSRVRLGTLGHHDEAASE